MEDILNSVSRVETTLALVENLIQNIFIFELPDGELVMNLRFNQSEDYESNLIGGLAATIQEFAAKGEEPYIKSINLEELKIIFTSFKQFLIVFAVDINYPDEQFVEAIEAFTEGFTACLKEQEYGSTTDGAAVSIQTLHSLISEDIHIELQMGKKVTLYAFKLRELAEATTSRVLGLQKETPDLYDDTSSGVEVPTNKQEKTPQEAMALVLKQFIYRFPDVKEITLIRTTMTGEFEKYTETRLEEQVSGNVYETVMGMIDLVSHLLEESIDKRTIDLGENGTILFQNVTELTFLYIVLKDAQSLETLEPIIERIAHSLQKHFPEDTQFFSSD